jgi:hypothetical protein
VMPTVAMDWGPHIPFSRLAIYSQWAITLCSQPNSTINDDG